MVFIPKKDLDEMLEENNNFAKEINELKKNIDTLKEDYDNLLKKTAEEKNEDLALLSSLKKLIPLSRENIKKIIIQLHDYNNDSSKSKDKELLLDYLGILRKEAQESSSISSNLIRDINKVLLEIIKFLNKLYHPKYGLIEKHANMYPGINKDDLNRIFEDNANIRGQFARIVNDIDYAAKRFDNYGIRPWTELPTFLEEKSKLIKNGEEFAIRIIDKMITDINGKKTVELFDANVEQISFFFDSVAAYNSLLEGIHNALPGAAVLEASQKMLVDQEVVLRRILAQIIFERGKHTPEELKGLRKRLSEVYTSMAVFRRTLLKCLYKIPGGNTEAIEHLQKYIPDETKSLHILWKDFKKDLTEDDITILKDSMKAYRAIIEKVALAIEDLDSMAEKIDDAQKIKLLNQFRERLNFFVDHFSKDISKSDDAFENFLYNNYAINSWIKFTLGAFPLWMKDMNASEVTEKVIADVAMRETLEIQRVILSK